MLVGLRLEHFAVVDGLELVFGPGLNVVTGETGAGKSVLIRAISLLLGGRSRAEWVRSGSEHATVEGLFEFQIQDAIPLRLRELGLDSSTNEASEGVQQVVVRRVITRAGRSRVTINGHLATVSMLSQLFHGSIDLTGQHESMSLLETEHHLELLDAFGGLTKESDLVRRLAKDLACLRKEMEHLILKESELAERENYLKFCISEFEQLNPKPRPNELVELEEKLTRIRQTKKIGDAIEEADGDLYSRSGSAIDQIERAERKLSAIASFDPELVRLLQRIAVQRVELSEVARELSGVRRRYGELQAENQDDLETRRSDLARLVRKYGTLEQAVSQHKMWVEELSGLSQRELRVVELKMEIERQQGQFHAAAETLKKARRKVGGVLSLAVMRELRELSLDGTEIRFEWTQIEPSEKGIEIGELYWSGARGETTQPLRRIASGGELSRILLALKVVLAKHSNTFLHVFDEVDAGIGGIVADTVGAKLKAVAKDCQVICVTHLPQIAAYAQHHFRVEKEEKDSRTETRVVALREGERVVEIGRMLGGDTRTSRGLARELRDRGRTQARVVG